MSVLEARDIHENKPYYAVSEFYKEKFGEKVFKIPVAIAGDCPNRMGLKGMKTCIFCDEWGSFAYPENQEDSLRQQIEKHQKKVADRYNTKKFLVYFQAYTTTFTQVKKLERAFEIALEYEGVVGIVVGTRPDCLSHKLFDIFKEYSEKTFMAVELGVQSFDDKQLEWMRRGHTAQDSVKAIETLKEKCPKLNIGIHLMFGWPGETDGDIVRSAQLCNKLGVDNVKLHNLHVLKNTPLEEMYQQNDFVPIERDRYADWVGLFINHLSPQIAIHRLVAIASRWEELVAPDWTKNKMMNFQYMLEYLVEKGFQQGKNYEAL